MCQVLPVVVDHIMWLMKEERRALGQLDCDMMMVAFAGQFVDTIVTNAVLKTQVDLSGKRAYTRTFVATSNGTSSRSGSGSGSGSSGSQRVSSGNLGGTGSGSSAGGVKSILRIPSIRYANDEKIESVWTRSSSGQMAGKAGSGNSSNNCNKVVPSTLRRVDACRPDARQDDEDFRHQRDADCVGNTNVGCTNNNNNHDDDGVSDWETADCVCDETRIRENNEVYSTCRVFHTASWLSGNVLCYYIYDQCRNSSCNNNNNNNSNGCNYNSDNDLADISDEECELSDAVAAATERGCNRRAGDGDCNNKRDGFMKRAVSDPTRQTRGAACGGDDEAVGGGSTGNEWPSFLAEVDDNDAVVDETLERYLSTSVSRLLSSLGSRDLAVRALHSANNWLSRYRDLVDSPPSRQRHRCPGRREVRLEMCDEIFTFETLINFVNLKKKYFKTPFLKFSLKFCIIII